MSLSDDDISLQEPLIPFTWPQRDDPGWNLLDELGAASLEPQGDNDDDRADTATRNEEDLQVDLLDKSPAKTLERLLRATRQSALEAEKAAEASSIAAREAFQADNLSSMHELRFEAASNEHTALDLHRRASCIIYTALNQNLPPGTIDLRGLRADELQIVRKIITTPKPELPVYRFKLDEPDPCMQRQVLDSIAKAHGLAFYYDGPATYIIVQDPIQWRAERLIEALRKQAEASTCLSVL